MQQIILGIEPHLVGDVAPYEKSTTVKILWNKATEETFWCPQTFIVRFLIIGTSATTGFYSRTERRGNRHVAVETKRERAWVCVHCEKMRLASIEKWMLGIASVWTTFYNFVYTGNLFKLREGGDKRKRKKDHKVSEIEQQIIEGCSGTLNAATTFCIHFPHTLCYVIL